MHLWINSFLLHGRRLLSIRQATTYLLLFSTTFIGTSDCEMHKYTVTSDNLEIFS